MIKNQVYRCSVCGNIVIVMYVGGGTLVCCGKEMELLAEKNTDQGLEKHVPVIERVGDVVTVKVGSVPHPMEEAHFIEWIELIADDVVYRKFLKPGDQPMVEFKLALEPKEVWAREYCNLHGLWRS